MKKLSTGADSTLASYRELCVAFFGADSPQVKFIDDKIAKSPNGANEQVLADEGQMVHLLGSLKA